LTWHLDKYTLIRLNNNSINAQTLLTRAELDA
jgi:hypothetical protein